MSVMTYEIMNLLTQLTTVAKELYGPLIPPDLQEKIFIPFFTTKKNGSGIGLSISQEIMKLHNGSLVVVSTEEDNTSFIMEF